MDRMWEKCGKYGIKNHLVSQMRHYSEFIRERRIEKLWFGTTGSRLTQKQKREVLKFIREMIDRLRAS